MSYKEFNKVASWPLLISKFLVIPMYQFAMLLLIGLTLFYTQRVNIICIIVDAMSIRNQYTAYAISLGYQHFLSIVVR